jgi:hypothetical protein
MTDHVLVGEVVAGFPPTHASNRSGVRWEYTVKAALQDGTQRVFQYCVATEAFGGLLNYVQQVVPCSGESTTKEYSSIDSPERRAGKKGARCVLAFPAGDTRYPVILGFLPHESSPVVVDQPENTTGSDIKLKDGVVYPKLHAAINGMEFVVSEIGEFIVTHYGHTEIEAGDSGKMTITPAPDTYNTQMSFLEKGEFQIADSKGQSFLIDPDLECIQIGNVSSNILLDQKGKLLSFTTDGKMEEVVTNDRYRYVGGIETIEFKKDQVITMEGNAKREIKGKIEEKITGAGKFTFENKLELTAKDTKVTLGQFTLTVDKLTAKSAGDVVIEGKDGAKLKLSGGKVALGNSTAELVNEVIKAIDALLPTNQSALCMTGVGPSGPLLTPAATVLASVKSKLSDIKGSL